MTLYNIIIMIKDNNIGSVLCPCFPHCLEIWGTKREVRPLQKRDVRPSKKERETHPKKGRKTAPKKGRETPQKGPKTPPKRVVRPPKEKWDPSPERRETPSPGSHIEGLLCMEWVFEGKDADAVDISKQSKYVQCQIKQYDQ